MKITNNCPNCFQALPEGELATTNQTSHECKKVTQTATPVFSSPSIRTNPNDRISHIIKLRESLPTRFTFETGSVKTTAVNDSKQQQPEAISISSENEIENSQPGSLTITVDDNELDGSQPGATSSGLPVSSVQMPSENNSSSGSSPAPQVVQHVPPPTPAVTNKLKNLSFTLKVEQ